MAKSNLKSKHLRPDLNGQLFPSAPNFRILQLGAQDAKKETDSLNVLKDLLLSNEAMYPNIDRWYATKVVPGLKTSERIAYVAFENDKPIASAVLKLGKRTKFCHLRIHEDFRDLDLGQMFFTQMTLEARHLAKEIHFTLPEGLWHEKADFFRSFGFTSVAEASRQYRNGQSELSCSAPTSVVWSCALKKLPHLLDRFSPGGYSMSGKLLLSMRPMYAERVFAQTKRVEIRKKFSLKWRGCRAVVYGSLPVAALMGEVKMSNVTPGSPAEIWKRFNSTMGCSHEEFNSYVGNSSQVYAIELTEAIPYKSPVGIAQISHLINEDLHPPQSFRDLKINSDDAWVRAISVAGLLHGRFGFKRSGI
jgi:predicted transcriptional regulator/N-acetylglutamate synthase-like GNAT family acetyltransferase